MTIPKTLHGLFGVGLLLGAGWTAQAQNNVTFQIDMTAQSPSAVYIRGSFNGWDTSWGLTNNGSGIWSGTFSDASAPGTVEACKFFYQPGDNWEGDPNRQFVLAGGEQTLPLTTWNTKDWPVPTSKVKFQVDMTAQVILGKFVTGSDYVRVSGGFNGWGGSADFTNNPSAPGDAVNIYSQTLDITGFPGSKPGNYKFRAPIGDTWETIPDRPSFTQTTADQVLPVVYWDNVAPATPTNANLIFRVDMTPQVLTGSFTNGSSEVTVSGGFNGWSVGNTLTNDPSLLGSASNVYSETITVSAFPGDKYRYKFRANGGWESAAIYGVGGNKDRELTIVGGDQLLPLVTYSDASLCDLLLQPTTTTFRLHLTNGTPDVNGVPFDKTSDQVYINGEFLGWPGWNTSLPEMTNNPVGSDYYELAYELPAGSPRGQKFKFGIAGAGHGALDNEAPQFQDHVQYIRTLDSSFVMPAAEFGTNFAATRIEPAFGNLVAHLPVGASIPITWLGLPCVTLQTKSPIGAATWTDLPATDGKSSTNWPNSGTDRYFRLQKRPLP